MSRVLVLVAVAAFLLLAGFGAHGATLTVSANPLWTDTGIDLAPSDTCSVGGATGWWTWAVTVYDGGRWFGPEGDTYWYPPEEWITSSMVGQLIGCVAPAGVNMNDYYHPSDQPRAVAQDDPSLFEIGAGSVMLTGRSGRLWLGFNDDYTSNSIGDNSGSVKVNVNLVPEPGTLVLLCPSLACVLFALRRRRWDSEDHRRRTSRTQQSKPCGGDEPPGASWC